MARWIAVDPLEDELSPESPYNYVENNPVVMEDDSGMRGRYYRVIVGVTNDGKIKYKWVAHHKSYWREIAKNKRRKKHQAKVEAQERKKEEKERQNQVRYVGNTSSGNPQSSDGIPLETHGTSGGWFSPESPPPSKIKQLLNKISDLWDRLKESIAKWWKNETAGADKWLDSHSQKDKNVHGGFRLSSPAGLPNYLRPDLDATAKPGVKSLDPSLMVAVANVASAEGEFLELIKNGVFYVSDPLQSANDDLRAIGIKRPLGERRFDKVFGTHTEVKSTDKMDDPTTEKKGKLEYDSCAACKAINNPGCYHKIHVIRDN